jgi:hypothetical protein
LRDVIRIEPSWTKLLNLIPVMPNAMKVFTRTEQTHSFVVYGRDAWISAFTSHRQYISPQ